MSKVPHLLKGSALPDGEQRRCYWFTVSATRITARRSRILASRWRIVCRLCWR